MTRFFQIRFTCTGDFNIAAFSGAPSPLPDNITCRALMTPDIATYICSAQAMVWIEPLDYDAEWNDATVSHLSDEQRDALRDWWNEALSSVERDADYYDWGFFCTSNHGGRPFPKHAHCLEGETDANEPIAPDEIRESAQVNHRV